MNIKLLIPAAFAFTLIISGCSKALYKKGVKNYEKNAYSKSIENFEKYLLKNE